MNFEIPSKMKPQTPRKKLSREVSLGSFSVSAHIDDSARSGYTYRTAKDKMRVENLVVLKPLHPAWEKSLKSLNKMAN